ncbi:MAG: DNA/RNA non-specific endonuclease [Candidatus Paralactobacillus gallistercoris]|uniref:DNA/RNA non-specific endonuclease n=1 Tax=Candidatus Paralactobacillus gallistercoris TaxID=2838724 RepID=A0A948TIT2_9LACO|nr:DNA/RNA non-specific endonuclease [Candidatus Paralactobacillus gallistercoris]
MHKSHWWKILPATLLASLMLAGCGNNHAQNATSTTEQPQTTSSTATSQSSSQNNDASTVQYLAGLTYQSNTNPIVQVNNGQATLNINNWNNNHVQYSSLDKLNRTSAPAIAYLDAQNVANDSLRVRQTVEPTGWHQKFDSNHEAILNRGHIIAYSLSKGINMNGQYNPNDESGDQNNPRNLFTQTAFCNQKLQTIYETKVRNALKQGAKVIYRVQPIFQGNDLMAKGVWMQAVGTNGLNFNVYLYNVQPGYQFNYATGTSVVDNNMQVPTPAAAPHFNDNNNYNKHYSNYSHHYYQKNRNHYYHEQQY